MRNTEKNRKQRFTYLPISIRSVLKIILAVFGFSVCGIGFIWILAGLCLFLPILRGILSFFVSLGAIILSILAMLAFL